jgi:RND family efflux transporter MFP subunit
VVSESVDVGQFVGNGSHLATVYGTEVVEVRVPLESRELAWFEVPSDGGISGSLAEISITFGGSRSTREGRVTRMEAEVDQSSRMVRVVIEVANPYDTSEDQPALLPGSFVDVRIFGRTLGEVVSIPRHAIREGGSVWVFDDGKLQIREVVVVREDRQQTWISSGLEEGELVIVSSLDAVTDGMTVRRTDSEAGGAV